MEKLARTQHILKTSASKYITATNADYSKWIQGSPTYITYFQIVPLATTHDETLENVHSLNGANSPNKYRRIYDVAVYGANGMDISTEITEKGLESFVTGEFVFLPDTIIPTADDFFIFDYEGLETHLFKIDDVQFDRATTSKYYKVSYSLYKDNADGILGNLLDDDYSMTYNTSADGTVTTGVVTTKDSEAANKAKTVVDAMIDKYVELFYDENSDNFVFRGYDNSIDGQLTFYYCPYVQKFLHDTKALSKYNQELLTEIYINDINQTGWPLIFNDSDYRASIFKNVQTKNIEVPMSSVFYMISDYDLKEKRNLPFFNIVGNYKLIDFYRHDDTNYLKARHILFDGVKDSSYGERYNRAFTNPSELKDKIANGDIKDGDLIYKVDENTIIPIRAVYMASLSDNKLSAIDVCLYKLLDKTNTKVDSILEKHYLFNIIKKFMNDELSFNGDELNLLLNERINYDPTIETYLLMPIVIYIVKELIANISK